jgi:hypothetical protein
MSARRVWSAAMLFEAVIGHGSLDPCHLLASAASQSALMRSSCCAAPTRPADKIVRCMRPESSRALVRPEQPERLRGDTDNVGIEVQRHHVIAFQPRLVTHMTADRRRPPPARQMSLSPIGHEPPHRSNVLKPQSPCVRQPQSSLIARRGHTPDFKPQPHIPPSARRRTQHRHTPILRSAPRPTAQRLAT